LKTWKSLVMPVEMETFAKAVRSHWLIENQLHWVLDVHFREDQSRARSKHAAQNLATLRRWALNLIKADQEKKKRSLKGRQKAAGWDNRYLLHLPGI
jgi:predicted transposase YbfD/YdcC